MRLTFGGTQFHVVKQAMGAIDREQADRGGAEYQSTEDA
jgi:hypothetical protein